MHYRTIWISDTHLGTRGCQGEKLQAFLKQNSCDVLYLVGDIIDGWRMKRGTSYWPQLHTDIIRTIMGMAKRGTKVIYVPGNHDDIVRRFLDFDTSFGNVDVVTDAVHVTKDGKKLWVVHGDLFDIVTNCHRWLAILGDHGYTFLLMLNRWLNKIRGRLGMGYWSLSKAIKHKVKQAVKLINDYEDVMTKECVRNGYDGVVCGHIHHPEIKELNGVMYYNDGDWVENCTALVETSDGSIELVEYHNGMG